MAIPIINISKTHDITSEYDPSPEGEKTIFKGRTLSAAQRSDFQMKGEMAITNGGELLKVACSHFSFFVAEIVGLDAPTQEYEYCGLKRTGIDKAWADQHIPAEIQMEVVNKVAELNSLKESTAKNSEEQSGSENM